MSIKEILSDIEFLTSPNDELGVTLEDVFAKKIQKFQNQDYACLRKIFPDYASLSEIQIRWNFACLLLEKLLELKTELQQADELGQILSVKEKKQLRTCFQMAIALGIIAHLPTGIGIALQYRSSMDLTMFKNGVENEKIASLEMTLLVLMELRKDPTLLTIITSNHLEDLLSSLFSLLIPGVWSKPIPENKRTLFKKHLQDIIDKTCQPFLLKELMVLNGNKNCPTRLSHTIRCIMTERLMLEGGVIATIRAILDIVGGITPNHWKTVEVLSKLLITPHIKNKEDYHKKVYPQILSLIYCKENNYTQIAVISIRLLHQKDPDTCYKYFIKQLIEPLQKESGEDEITECLTALHNCFGIPGSEHWSLNPEIFSEIHVNLFRIYTSTLNSLTFLKPILSDIVSSIASGCDLKKLFDQFIFGTSSIDFNYGDKGGIVTKKGKINSSWESTSEQFLDLILSKNSTIILNLFNILLDIMIEETIEKKLVGAKILSEICVVPNIQNAINKDSHKIVKFIKNLIEGDYNNELCCLGLMVLSIILSDRSLNKTRDWKTFKELAEPLKKYIIKCENKEIRILADDLYSTIVTHGVVTKEQVQKTKKYDFNQAMDEATDPLMPVRAHGIKQLGRLVINNDSKAVANKETILCILKENLKEDDSYVYLAAVEGLASVATSFPDETLTLLCEQYTNCKESELRLKVGEVLIKVVQLLNEMAVVYKHELINAFLSGCCDDDHLVRASSLSNLGELCRILSYRIHNYLTEILYCIECIFDTDKFIEPRRAAVMTLTGLLKGLGPEALTVLESVMLELYRKLKFIYSTEKDDITKLHAQLALEEINACTLSCFRQPLKLEKRIFVLDPPS